MIIDAILCDAVTVREGLLHVLGGGISRVTRPLYPAPVGVELALQITMTPQEREAREVTLVVTVIGADGVELGGFDGGFVINGEFAADVDSIVTIPVNLGHVILPTPGRYRVEVTAGAPPTRRSVHFNALVPAAAPDVQPG